MRPNPRALSKLKSSALDFAIVEGRITDPDFSSVMLDTDSLVVIVSPYHHLAKQGSISLPQLQKETLIMRAADSGTRKLFESHLMSRNLSIEDFNVILEIDNVSTIKNLVRKNLGLSVLAKSTCQHELDQGKLIMLPILDLSMIREINVVYNKDFTQTSFLNDIVQLYNKTLHQIAR